MLLHFSELIVKDHSGNGSDIEDDNADNNDDHICEGTSDGDDFNNDRFADECNEDSGQENDEVQESYIDNF